MNKKLSRLEETFSCQSSYCYPDTNVLINKFNCRDGHMLQKIESIISALKLTTLYEQKTKPELNIDYYLELHQFIFNSIYPFAGKIRNENIQKSNYPYFNSVTPFCRPEFIYNNLKKTLQSLIIASKKWKTKEDMIKDIAYYYSEVNIIHPFREGNGRIQREFFRQFINQEFSFGQFELDYTKINDRDNILIKASIISALTGETNLLEDFFSICLVQHELSKDVRR